MFSLEEAVSAVYIESRVMSCCRDILLQRLHSFKNKSSCYSSNNPQFSLLDLHIYPSHH